MTVPAIRPMIRAKEFFKLTGIPDSTRADWENPKSTRYDPTFPKKMKLGRRCTMYYWDEVQAWLETRRVK